MSDFYEALLKTKKKLELTELINVLESENRVLSDEIPRLRIISHNEQADVDNLESSKIKLSYLRITGKLEERLNKERTEARNATSRYEFALSQQKHILLQLENCIDELATLGNCEEVLRDQISFPEDATLNLLKQCTTELPQISKNINLLLQTLNKVSQWATIRNGTQSTASLSGTSDQLLSAEHAAQTALIQIKTDLQNYQTLLQPFEIILETNEIQKFPDNYLTELYTYALISNRVQNVIICLRQIGFQLNRINPKIIELQKKQTLVFLRSLLDAANSAQ